MLNLDIQIAHAPLPGEPLYLQADTEFGLYIIGPFKQTEQPTFFQNARNHIQKWVDRGEKISQVRVVGESAHYDPNFRCLLWPDHDTQTFAEHEASLKSFPPTSGGE